MKKVKVKTKDLSNIHPDLPEHFGEMRRIVRIFPTGATRDSEGGKLDPEGFLSPRVLQIYCEYLHKHRKQSDGTLRDSDNWTKGIPLDVYMKSMTRHLMDVWLHHRGYSKQARGGRVDALCGLLFNGMGYLFELDKQQSLMEASKDLLNEYKEKRFYAR